MIIVIGGAGHLAVKSGAFFVEAECVLIRNVLIHGVEGVGVSASAVRVRFEVAVLVAVPAAEHGMSVFVEVHQFIAVAQPHLFG